MKKYLILLLALTIALPLFGCGAKEKIEEKAGEEIAENVMENASGSDVEIDGDKVSIQDKEGNKLEVGGSEWPTSDLAKSIPEFKQGTVASVLDSTDSVFISLENVKQEDYMAYLDTIKKDYTKDSFESSTEDFLSYGASNDAGISVQLQYANETLTITVAKTAQ